NNMTQAAKDYTINVPANSEQVLPAYGEYVRCIDSNQTEFKIGLESEAATFFAQGCELRITKGQPNFKNVTIANPNGTALEARIVIGYGQFKDDRLQSSGNVDSQLVTPTVADDDPNKVVPTGVQTSIFEIDTDRAMAFISNMEPVGGQTVFVGVAPSGGRGIPLAPMTTVAIATTEKMRCWHDKGSDVEIGMFFTKWA
ncbi:MAG: hypothetical protein P8P30_00180, partial [Rickettsiales bacterium]|nr:hypothetical protein [Rickettsiales bacterium]